MFQPGQRVGVAVSGGPDSVCLLHVLMALAPRWNLRLSVLHLNHLLRGPESDADAGFVRGLAERLGLPLYLEATDVNAEAAANGDNLEQAARLARRRFFFDFLNNGKLDRVALGHTRSDQAETVLYRFLRGSGTAGLAGIRPITSEGLVRPLLEISRAEVESYLKQNRIPFRQDSSNFDLGFARNRIRRELLPQLEREWNPNLADLLAQTAQWAQAEETYWESETARLAEIHLARARDSILLKADVVAWLQEAPARRLLRRAVLEIKGDLRGVDFAHIESLMGLARAGEGHARVQIPGVDVLRSFEWMRFSPLRRGAETPRNYRFTVSPPGIVPLPGGGEVHLEIVESTDRVYNMLMGALNWESVPRPLEVRNWRPGDQYKPVCRTGDEKIKTLFQEARVPLWERRDWPVVTGAGDILWSRRFGPAAAHAATPASRSLLIIRETGESSCALGTSSPVGVQ
jgi:tRNA(Ile)-lysidine synthase